MIRHNEERKALAFLQGRIEGLAGTTRYNLPDALRTELREIGEYINRVTQIHAPKGKDKAATGDPK